MAAEDIHDVDLLRHIEQRGVSFLAQAFFNVRIHWNDAVSVALHVGGNAVAGTHRIAGESDHCDCFGPLKKIGNRIGFGRRGHNSSKSIFCWLRPAFACTSSMPACELSLILPCSRSE